MRYIGTKSATLPHLGGLVERNAPGATSICDPFAGTCSVARFFKARGMRVVTGDVMAFSHMFQLALVGLNQPPAFSGLLRAGELARGDRGPMNLLALARLASLPARAGYLTEHYSPACGGTRLFFTERNAARLDAMRGQIAAWKSG